MNPPAASEYQTALDWLFSQTRAGGERSPARAAALLARMGLKAPEHSVSVVGTNGKGTVTAMIAAGLSAAGHKTGRFISPHVESFRERVAVNGTPIAEAQVVDFVRAARELVAASGGAVQPPPAFFEWTLALALSEFARQRTHSAVFEAGVGGASDATHALPNVELVVLTNVDLDHVDVLGPTLELIAADKAGAIRPGTPVVSGVTQPHLQELVAREAHRSSAPLHQVRAEGTVSTGLFHVPPELAGVFSPTRLANARLAAASLRLLGLNEAAVTAGLSAPALPARGERFLVPMRGPLGVPPVVGVPPAVGVPRTVDAPPSVEVLLDGAHDPAAARQLLLEIGGRPYALLFGALGRKQGAAVLEVLAPGATSVVLTEAQAGDGHPAPPAAPADFVADPEAALQAALAAAAEGALESKQRGAPPTALHEAPGAHNGGSAARPLLVVAGSLYLAGRVRPLLRGMGERLPAAWEAQQQSG